MKRTIKYTYISTLTGRETTEDDRFGLKKSIINLSISKKYPGQTSEEVAEQGGLVHLLRANKPESWKELQMSSSSSSGKGKGTGRETTEDDSFEFKKSSVSSIKKRKYLDQTPEEMAEQGGLVHLLRANKPESWKESQMSSSSAPKKIKYTYISTLTGRETTEDDRFGLKKSIINLSISKKYPGQTSEEVAEQDGLVHLLRANKPESWKELQMSSSSSSGKGKGTGRETTEDDSFEFKKSSDVKTERDRYLEEPNTLPVAQGVVAVLVSDVKIERDHYLEEPNTLPVAQGVVAVSVSDVKTERDHYLEEPNTLPVAQGVVAVSVSDVKIERDHYLEEPNTLPVAQEVVAEQGGLVHLLRANTPEACKELQMSSSSSSKKGKDAVRETTDKFIDCRTAKAIEENSLYAVKLQSASASASYKCKIDPTTRTIYTSKDIIPQDVNVVRLISLKGEEFYTPLLKAAVKKMAEAGLLKRIVNHVHKHLMVDSISDVESEHASLEGYKALSETTLTSIQSFIGYEYEDDEYSVLGSDSYDNSEEA